MPDVLPPPNPAEVKMLSPNAKSLGATALGEAVGPVIFQTNNLKEQVKSDRGTNGNEPSKGRELDYNEVTFISETNGDTRISLKTLKQLVGKLFTPTAKHDKFGPSISGGSIDGLAYDIEQLGPTGLEHEKAALYDLTGLHYNEDDSFTYPSQQHLEENLDYVAEETGHAPNIKTINKVEIDVVEELQAYSEGFVPLSGAPEVRVNDLVAKLPYMLALPKETFELISSNATDLLKKHTEAGSPDAGPTKEAITNYLNSLEHIGPHLVDVVRKNRLNDYLAPVLDASMHSDSPYKDSYKDLSKDKQAEVNRHGELLKERLVMLESLASQQQIAA